MKVHALFLATLLSACQSLTAPPEVQVGDPIEVMSFNIRYGTARDGENVWEFRRELVVAAIRDAEPDVLGLQEALRFQLDELERALPGYVTYAVGRDDGRSGGEHAAILFNSKRFVPEATGTFWLSNEPETPGSIAWGANLPRLCSWVRLHELETGARLTVFNTHWDHESQEARARSGVLIRDRLVELTGGEHALLMGDFNATPDNPAILRLVGDVDANPPIGGGDLVLRDSLRVVHPTGELGGTYSGFKDALSTRRIDYIFVTPDLEVLDASIDTRRPEGRWPSDHTPVRATIALPR